MVETDSHYQQPEEPKGYHKNDAFYDQLHDPQVDDPNHSPDEKGKDGDKGKDAKKENPKKTKQKKLTVFIILGIVLLIAAVIGTMAWLHARHFEETDDAFIDGHIAQVAPQVSGQVMTLRVDDNQEVQAGDLLFALDPRDYQAKVNQAAAALANAQAGAVQAAAQIDVQLAALGQANANTRNTNADLGKAQRDLARFHAADPRAVVPQQLDQAATTVKNNNAKLDANRQAARSAAAQLTAVKAQAVAAAAASKQAEADLETARLQLSYTQIYAPQDGRVTQRRVEVGNYLNAGQPELSVVPHDMWITANFKETQLTHMQIGQTVRIKIDAYPAAKITGHVDSMQRGTGAVFSTLPAENATGNYVKIVQRVPVKIIIDSIKYKDKGKRHQDVQLAPGLSVLPRVRID